MKSSVPALALILALVGVMSAGGDCWRKRLEGPRTSEALKLAAAGIKRFSASAPIAKSGMF